MSIEEAWRSWREWLASSSWGKFQLSTCCIDVCWSLLLPLSMAFFLAKETSWEKCWDYWKEVRLDHIRFQKTPVGKGCFRDVSSLIEKFCVLERWSSYRDNQTTANHVYSLVRPKGRRTAHRPFYNMSISGNGCCSHLRLFWHVENKRSAKKRYSSKRKLWICRLSAAKKRGIN